MSVYQDCRRLFCPPSNSRNFFRRTGIALFPHRTSLLSRVLPTSHHNAFFSTTPVLLADFTHTIIGGGIIGLCCALSLTSPVPKSSQSHTTPEPPRVLLLERHTHPGTETTSRNSSVIHAGLYYPPRSLKARLCIRGKKMLYRWCEEHGVETKRTGKWLIAQDDAELGKLREVEQFTQSVGDGVEYLGGSGDGFEEDLGRRFEDGGKEEMAVPVRWVGEEERREREPDVRAEAGVLESTSTGIVDSHALVLNLLGAVEEAGGTVAFGTAVSRVQPSSQEEGAWDIYTTENDCEGGRNETKITTNTIINSAGNMAIPLSNSILPPDHPSQRTPAYAKGTYYAYSPSSSPAKSMRPRNPQTLLYPVPTPGLGGLGTHLTLDLAGAIRLGPDVQWLEPTIDLASATIYGPNEDNLDAAAEEIQRYLPYVKREDLHADYVGIRPKLRREGVFEDFYIRRERVERGGDLVNLLGMESPGLTGALAVGEYVRALLARSE